MYTPNIYRFIPNFNRFISNSTRYIPDILQNKTKNPCPKCASVPGFVPTQQTQNICITFVQRRPNVFNVGPTLYKYYTNVLCLLGITLVSTRPHLRTGFSYSRKSQNKDPEWFLGSKGSQTLSTQLLDEMMLSPEAWHAQAITHVYPCVHLVIIVNYLYYFCSFRIVMVAFLSCAHLVIIVNHLQYFAASRFWWWRFLSFYILFPLFILFLQFPDCDGGVFVTCIHVLTSWLLPIV